jgi:uncharacterized Fe-S center protein
MNFLNRIVVCCDCNRPTLTTMQDAGFSLARVDLLAMQKAPSFVSPLAVGAATAPPAAASPA